MSTNDQESEILKKKIQKLLQENSGLADEVRNAQENVRLSNAQQSKAFQELTEYKKRIEQNDAENDGIKRKMQNLIQENQHLGEEVRNAQENLRLSANQISKLNNELGEYKSRVTANNQESETYKQKIQKLLAREARKSLPPEQVALIFSAVNRDPTIHTLIRHEHGHRDHMHVRFVCEPGNLRCRTSSVDRD